MLRLINISFQKKNENGQAQLNYVATNSQTADILTKALPNMITQKVEHDQLNYVPLKL